ncbi:MAG: FdhF/YdeP family oxidoreductase [Candidatus Dormibacteraeota bacterium]|nr:FdhF/YdeP family oxidoreductase [Candidatus Dormibacteraeota bacterium]
MARGAPRAEQGDTKLRIRRPEDEAVGPEAIVVALGHAREQMGVVRGTRALYRLNRVGGFDCPGCAWPDPEPGERSKIAEFCENGAKAVAEEATLRRVRPEFFAAHPVSELATHSDYWLGQQGRLTEPMFKEAGDDFYRPIAWEDAFGIVAEELQRLPSPNQAVFYTSGKTSNEAAFCYQLFARALGTNNLPDCSNMCHESSGSALSETIGIGKGSVSLDDINQADLVIIAGQNPGTNHPRMLTALETAKREGGARIVAVNPLPEAGLLRYRNPQHVRGVLGEGVPIADLFCQIRIGGDMAFFQALGRLLLEEEERRPGEVLDHAFLDRYTDGFDAYARHARELSWETAEAATGMRRAEIEEVARLVMQSKRIVVCWAMGLTQHRDAVATIREIVNFLLLRGNLGRPGAGVCPVRGHSNVQGDRTVGIWEKMPQAFLDALGDEFDFVPPAEHGYDTVEAIRALRDGRASVFVGLGGNFVRATPDSALTESALRRCRLTVQISTKLNLSHVICGERALILPTLGRTEIDRQASGPQAVTVEDSMSMVHLSQGHLEPAASALRSEVAIVCGLAERTLGPAVAIDWAGLSADYDRIREHISHVVPGFERFNERVRVPGGFQLPHPPRDGRVFKTSTGRAHLTVNEVSVLRVPPGRLLLQTIRSHDQYNTTIYGLDDRYRGIMAARRVVLVNPDDIAELGLHDGQRVDLVSEWAVGGGGSVEERRARDFRIVAYPTARGCAAAYFPETNVLVPLDSTAQTSNTPTSKSIVVRLEATAPQAAVAQAVAP